MLKKGTPAHAHTRLKRLLSLLLAASLLAGLSPRVSALWEADLVKTAIRAGVQTGSYLYEDAYFQAADAPMEAQDSGDVPSAWARRDIALAIRLGLVPMPLQNHYSTPVSRSEFADLAVQTISILSRISRTQLFKFTSGKSKFTDCSEPAVIIAAELGIVSGTPDGHFNPGNRITRQEAAAMLSRISLLLGLPVAPATGTFSDISGLWGVKQILASASTRDPYTDTAVMNGVGGGRFSPSSAYSREQAVATLLRLTGAVNGTLSGFAAGAHMDQTGFNRQDETWDTAAAIPAAADASGFPTGKWIRQDGQSVLYLRSGQTIRETRYLLHAAAAGEAGAFNEDGVLTADTSKLAHSADGMVFEVLAGNRLRLTSNTSPEQRGKIADPSGIYRRHVTAEPSPTPGPTPVPKPEPSIVPPADIPVAATGKPTTPANVAETGMEKSPRDTGDDYIDPRKLLPPEGQAPIGEKVKHRLLEALANDSLHMSGTRTCENYYWTDKALFNQFITEKSIGPGYKYASLTPLDKARVTKIQAFLIDLPFVGSTMDASLKLTLEDGVASGSLNLGSSEEKPVSGEKSWMIAGMDFYKGYVFKPDAGLLEFYAETQPLLKPERTVRAAMRLSFALNEEGKLVAEGTLAMSDWSSWRGVFPVRFEED